MRRATRMKSSTPQVPGGVSPNMFRMTALTSTAQKYEERRARAVIDVVLRRVGAAGAPMRSACLSLMLALASGCVVQESTPQTVVGEHTFLNVSKVTKAIGSDCSVEGPQGCQSSICIHTGLEKDTGFVCSQACEDDNSCPQGWRCTEVSSESFCLPAQEESVTSP